MNTLEKAHEIVRILEDKLGEDILLLEIAEIASFTDYFIICTGTSNRMLDALAEELAKNVKGLEGWAGQIEGKPTDGWMVFDVGDIVVHLFTPEQREYYKLEQLWGEGKILLRLQ